MLHGSAGSWNNAQNLGMQVRIVMTGCHGFVGKNLVDYFSQLGVEVIGLTNGDQINPKLFAQLRIKDIVYGSNRLRLLKELALFDCDYFIHLSAILDENHYFDELIRVNSLLTLDLARIAIEIGIPQFVYISTVTVVGAPQDSPIDEGHLLNPKNNYERTKLIAEYLLRGIENLGTKIDILRIPAPIGSYLPHHRFFYKVVKSISNGQNPRIYSFGQRIQNYLDIRDLGRAVLLLRNYPKSELFLIRGLDELSNTEAVKKIISLTNPTLKIEFSEMLDIYDSHNWSIDGSKAFSLLNYEPIYGIEDCIQKLWWEVRAIG